MSVDPDSVVRAPMSRNPNPVSSPGPISRAVDVIWLVANIDVEGDGIGNTANAQYGHKKQREFFHMGGKLDLFGAFGARKKFDDHPVRP